MTPENISQAVESVTKSDRPFMVLFVIVLFVVIFMAFRILKYFENANLDHKEEMNRMTETHKQERDAAYKAFDKREKHLFRNLDENTKRIGEIADTLKEIKFDFSNLENKVEVLSDEIVKIKTQVTKDEDHA